MPNYWTRLNFYDSASVRRQVDLGVIEKRSGIEMRQSFSVHSVSRLSVLFS